MSPAAIDKRQKIDSICIIGAGPSGLAAAKYLLAERTFSRIVIFEQRNNVGGLWNHLSSPADSARNSVPIPQTNPYAQVSSLGAPNGNSNGHGEHSSDSETVISPVYDLLETNIPRGLMGFSDLGWDDKCQLFPQHEAVLDYLERYSADVQHLIQFETEVLDVLHHGDRQWKVRVQSVERGTHVQPDEQIFDAVLVASGHFDVPYIPAVQGIEAWNDAHPGQITHSKFYRRPEDFQGKKTIVVGNSASGVDIGAQISTACKLPLLQSSKSEASLQPASSVIKVEKPQIVEFIAQDRQVRFSDGSTESKVDAVVYCTGYFYSYPFLRSLDPPLITSGEYVENLYQHVFYRPQPTLAFVALNQKIIPFPVAEAQSSVIARVWSGRLSLPKEQQMEDWERHTLLETGGGRGFHVLQFPKDADYINMLHDWAMSGERQANGHHEIHKRRMSSTGRETQMPLISLAGKEPPYWGEKEYWTRERFPAIKKAFQAFGEERHAKRTLEDVGFSFEDWKREALANSKRLL